MGLNALISIDLKSNDKKDCEIFFKENGKEGMVSSGRSF